MTGNYGCIACDIGGTNVRVSLIAGDFTIIAKRKELSGSNPVEILTCLINSVISETPDGLSLKGIGLAVAGIIDSTSDVILRSPNIPSLKGFDLKAALSNQFSMPVIVENDANAAAYGEKITGSGRAFRDFVMLTLGTGIGGGIVVNNALLPVSAEIGHVTINTDGMPCSCGNKGCLEAYASATAITRNTVTAIQQGADSNLKTAYDGAFIKINAADIYDAAKEGDALADSVLKNAGRFLGIGIANVINILGPQAVILTGGLIGAWDIYVEAAISEASKRAMPELFERVQILRSSLGDDAGAIGIAALVFNQNK